VPAEVWFGLLGSVELVVDGARRDLGSAKHRCLLAILLLEPDSPLSTDELVDRLWGDSPPDCARNALYSYLARLRQRLRGTGAEVRRRAGGYLLDVGAARVDVRCAATLVSHGRLDQALDLWRGGPLTGLSGAWVERVRARLHRERLAQLVDWAGARLAAGAAADVASRLQSIVDENPLVESLVARYLQALHDTGHTDAALDRYRRTMRRLETELGTGPGAVLTEVHRTLTALRPAQLPATPAGFVGREHELDELDVLAGAGVMLVTGMPGAGKTALTLTWAHRVRARFPDGQLYLNLRGSAMTGPVSSASALAGFLHALGVAPNRIPADEIEAACLYRSLLAGRRLLVVLDDAASAAQVRPLLPGGSAGAVVITSRQRLSSLVVGEGARPLRLPSLSEDDSRALVSQAVGTVDPDAAAELIALCGHLPLALRIAVADLCAEPDRTVAGYVRELRATTPLAADAVRGAFDLSYQRLAPAERRLFRLLTRHPGTDFTADIVAALADVDPAGARRLVDRLAGAHLIEPGTGPRYRMPDLLRRYADERAGVEESPAGRAAAAHRLGEFYLRATDRAVRLAAPTLAMPAPESDTSADSAAARCAESALAWLDAERTNLVLLCARAAELGLPELPWRLSALLRGYFQLRAYDDDWRTVIDTGIASARVSGSPSALATATLSRGYRYRMRGPAAAAVEAFTDAVRLAEEAGWTTGAAAALSQLGLVYPRVGRAQDGVDCLARAIDLARRIQDQAIEGAAHGNAGAMCADRGPLPRALAHLRAELDLLAFAPSPFREANALADVGRVLTLLGEPETAIETHRQALSTARALDHRGLVANVLVNLAAAYLALDRNDEAAEHAWLAMEQVVNLRAGGVVAEARAVLAAVDDAAGRTAMADTGYREAVAAARASGDPLALTEVLTRVAERATAMSDVDTALAGAREHGYRVHEARALCAAAELHLANGRPDCADEAARAALNLCRATGHRPGVGRALAVLARAGTRFVQGRPATVAE